MYPNAKLGDSFFHSREGGKKVQGLKTKNVASVANYLTDEQAASLLGVSGGTIKRWRLEGRLGFLRIGPRRVVIRPEDVTAFIEGGMQPAKAA